MALLPDEFLAVANPPLSLPRLECRWEDAAHGIACALPLPPSDANDAWLRALGAPLAHHLVHKGDDHAEE